MRYVEVIYESSGLFPTTTATVLYPDCALQLLVLNKMCKCMLYVVASHKLTCHSSHSYTNSQVKIDKLCVFFKQIWVLHLSPSLFEYLAFDLLFTRVLNPYLFTLTLQPLKSLGRPLMTLSLALLFFPFISFIYYQLLGFTQLRTVYPFSNTIFFHVSASHEIRHLVLP